MYTLTQPDHLTVGATVVSVTPVVCVVASEPLTILREGLCVPYYVHFVVFCVWGSQE